MDGKIPPVMWIAIIAMGLYTVLSLSAGLARGSPALLLTAGANAALLLGLAKGKKWAYVIAIVVSGVSAAFAFWHSLNHGMSVLLADSLVAVPVILSTRFFFPPETPEAPSPPLS